MGEMVLDVGGRTLSGAPSEGNSEMKLGIVLTIQVKRVLAGKLG